MGPEPPHHVAVVAETNQRIHANDLDHAVAVDLPAADQGVGERLRASIVSGVITYREGDPTRGLDARQNTITTETLTGVRPTP